MNQFFRFLNIEFYDTFSCVIFRVSPFFNESIPQRVDHGCFPFNMRERFVLSRRKKSFAQPAASGKQIDKG